MIFDKVLLFTDMDCTLLNDNHEISEENIEALEKFVSLGGRFAFASGRAPQSLKRYTEKIMPNMPAICYNGAIIYNFEEKKLISSNPMDNGIKEVAGKALKEIPEVGVIVDTAKDIYLLNDTPGSREFCKVVSKEPIYREIEEIEEEWVKLAFWVEPEKICLIKEFLERTHIPESVWGMRTYSWSYELMRRDSDKGLALQRFREIYPGCKIFAAGDNENDINMLKSADVSFAAANAVSKVKECSDYVLDTDCNHSLMIEVIEKINKMI